MITLCIISFALYSRFMRASMLDVINSDYIRTARSKGVPEHRVIARHVMRNALIPITTVAALNIGGLLGGAIVTETVFSLDGIGYYFVQKLGQLDLYAVMAYLLVTAVIIIVFNLVADILYGFLDPRIRLELAEPVRRRPGAGLPSSRWPNRWRSGRSRSSGRSSPGSATSWRGGPSRP